jgi:hypothetical protein
MTTSEDNQIDMEEGRNAALVQSIVKPFIDEQLKNAMTMMVNEYRAGNTSHDMLVGKVAEMKALMGLMSSLDTVQRLGISAMKREYGNGKED